MNNSIKRKANLDDGCNPELAINAIFDGILGIPTIHAPNSLFIPKGITPFSELHRTPTNEEAIGFFEKDPVFSEVLINPTAYIETFSKFKAIITVDCSLYRDAPPATHVINIYRSRLIGSYYQSMGINVIPLVRWGNKYTYTTEYFPEKVAFLGIEKNSMVAVSTYGCIGGIENKYHFRAGLDAMLTELNPSTVLVYGSMPDCVFNPYLKYTNFILYENWTTRMKGGK